MLRIAAFFLLALSSICLAQENVFADGFNYPHCARMSVDRSNIAIMIAPGLGASDLKLRMAIADLPVRKGEALQGALVGQGGTAPYVYPPITGLPPGVSLNSSTGILSGTPTTVGKYTFLAEVQDAALGDYKCTFSIKVIPPLEIVAGDPPDEEEDYSTSYFFEVSGATGTMTWAISAGTLPLGISLDSGTGELSGTPGAFSAGDYSFVVTATDGGSGDSIDIPCGITVYTEFTGAVTSVTSTVAGVPFEIDYPEITAGKPPYNFNYSSWNSTIPGDTAGVQPSWLTVTPQGVISGTPPDIGAVFFSLLITDALGATRVVGFHINVNQAVIGPTSSTNNNVALFDGASGGAIKDSGFSLAGVAVTTANVGTSATLSHGINRYTAANVHGTTPAAPSDFQDMEILIEDASFTGCTLVANSGQTLNGAASFSFDILPCVFRFRYNLSATNWFVTYYRIGTI